MKNKESILLIEPAYKNSYPPLGLMKISMWHKKIGDDVEFIKDTPHDPKLDLYEKNNMCYRKLKDHIYNKFVHISSLLCCCFNRLL